MGVNRAFRDPPLAFSGNKKYWAAELADEAALLPPGATVWDCFGGSGVCARCVKDARPDVRVIWNDFDGYAERLRHVAESEELRKTLLRVCGYDGCETPSRKGFHARLPDDIRAQVHSICRAHEERFGFLDGLLVRRWLSIGAAKGFYDLKSPPTDCYARVPKNPLNLEAAANWLDGLEAVRYDVSDLPVGSGDFVILDPPYVETKCDEYANGDTLRALRVSAGVLRSHKFILFGDASISFLYDVLTEKYHPRFFQKDGIVASMKRGLRSEVMYSNW